MKGLFVPDWCLTGPFMRGVRGLWRYSEGSTLFSVYFLYRKQLYRRADHDVGGCQSVSTCRVTVVTVRAQSWYAGNASNSEWASSLCACVWLLLEAPAEPRLDSCCRAPWGPLTIMSLSHIHNSRLHCEINLETDCTECWCTVASPRSSQPSLVALWSLPMWSWCVSTAVVYTVVCCYSEFGCY